VTRVMLRCFTAINVLLFCAMAMQPRAATAGLTSSGTLPALSEHEVPGKAQRTLTLEERVSYQRAIEEVYWRHRIWPNEDSNPKPSLDAVMTQAQLEEKVEDYLRKSQALEHDSHRPITPEQLQAEMDRMAQNTRQPEVLQELFEALGNDPFVVAECLARPMLAKRLLAHPEFEQVKQQSRTFGQTVAAGANYILPTISDPSGGCIGNTWTPTNLTGTPEARGSHTAVWTGSEMIVWGGYGCDGNCVSNTGGRYNPSTDSWTATSTTNAPEGRVYHTAVWNGSEMIVWGGFIESVPYSNSGGRYNPTTDSWTATSTTNVPGARFSHTAVWTGSEMIVWGGSGDTINFFFNTGGRYNPSTNSWTATSTVNAPAARNAHTAVWTGTQMIVWGGQGQNGPSNTGGRYNPSTNSWTATSTANAPEGREFHTAVWTGSKMIVWGGQRANAVSVNTGGRYNPSTNSWTATSIGNAPDVREQHTAIWTGSNMIVWGGIRNSPFNRFNSGGRYYPDIDLWVSTSTTNAPSSRESHTAVWTGSEMVVWGGGSDNGLLNTGGRYCVPSGIPSPTPAPTPCPGGYAVCNTSDSGPGSLRQAILDASPGDTITFGPSVTTVTLTSGELVIDKNLIITGPGANRLTVQVDTSAIRARVFNIRASTTTVFISGITISNGFAQDGPGGGGILSAGVLRLTDCTVSGNIADGQFGGVLGGGGVMNDHGTMTITGCTISNNSVDASIGGGGVLNENGTMGITRCTISNNDATPPVFSYDDSKGGGILNDSGGLLVITNSTISSNTSSAYSWDPLFPAPGIAFGGGVDNSGSMTIANCTISGNSAVAGGITSVDTGYGGGISNGGNLQITSSTIALNSASGDNAFGGGIYGDEPTGTDGSIIALNSAPVGPDFTGAGGLQSTGYNIVGNNADAVINFQPTDQIGTPAAPIDPLLGPLAYNGGPTLTHALQPGSPAIDRGDPAAPLRDQRGYSRLGVPDVGAFEFGGSAPRADFNGDWFTDYLLFNSSNRATAIWYLHDNIYISAGYGPTLPTGWTIADVADFNGDGNTDYALFNASTRQTAIWYLNNRIQVGGGFGPTLPSGWQLVAIGDFNGDNKPDYVLYNGSTRQTAIWYLNDRFYESAAYGPTLPSGWQLVAIGDFNGDSKPDYVLYHASTRQTAIWYLNNNIYVSAAYGPTIASGYVVSGVADFDGDGKPDYALYRAGTRQTAIWYLNNNVYIRSAFGPTLPAGWSLVAP
jgi:N-acetylneuraminic acid mutarotase